MESSSTASWREKDQIISRASYIASNLERSSPLASHSDVRERGAWVRVAPRSSLMDPGIRVGRHWTPPRAKFLLNPEGMIDQISVTFSQTPYTSAASINALLPIHEYSAGPPLSKTQI